MYEYSRSNTADSPALLPSFQGKDGDSRYSQPRDLDLIQSTHPLDLLAMKAPPRVLTLTEQPLDSLETDQAPAPQAQTNKGVSSN